MEKEKTIFDFLNAIFIKTELKYDKKVAPAYLLSLWLAHDTELLPIVNRINQYHFMLKDDVIYKYYYNAVPKGRRFIKWTKKMEMPAEQKEFLEGITATYGISKREAMLYKKLYTIGRRNAASNSKTTEFFD